jgi:glyoxylase-like metal-dependent hydrolase (beta-lactamase superfamily II)
LRRAWLAAPYLIAGRSGPARGKAPMQGPAQPSHYRFKLGAFEITTLSDGAVVLDGPHPIFGNNQSAAKVQKYAEANLLPRTKHQISFTPVIVNTGATVVLFDSGNGGNGFVPRPAAGRLAEAIRAAGFDAGQIDVVAVTHCHPDHIGGLMEGGKPAFPNARLAIGEAEFAFWSAPERLSGETEGMAKLTQSNIVPLKDKMTLLKPDGEVAPGIRAVGAFGHTPGHTAYHIESEGKRLLLWGDICNHPVFSLQKPDWHVSFDMDKQKAVETRRKLFDMVATDRIPFTGYHFPFPAVGFVEKKAAGYRYVPATYQLAV